MKNIFKTGVVVFSLAALAMTGCKKDDFVKPEELDAYVKKSDGGYMTGTISGTRTDGSTYSFPFEYMFNSEIDYSVSTSNNERILYFDLSKRKDQNSNDYLYFSGSLNFTKKTFISFGDIDGNFSQLTSDNKKFVYGFDYDSGDLGTYNWSNIAYDENSQMLTADFTLDMPENNVLGFNNKKATKITGKVGFMLPKEQLNGYTEVYMAPTK